MTALISKRESPCAASRTTGVTSTIASAPLSTPSLKSPKQTSFIGGFLLLVSMRLSGPSLGSSPRASSEGRGRRPSVSTDEERRARSLLPSFETAAQGRGLPVAGGQSIPETQQTLSNRLSSP